MRKKIKSAFVISVLLFLFINLIFDGKLYAQGNNVCIGEGGIIPNEDDSEHGSKNMNQKNGDDYDYDYHDPVWVTADWYTDYGKVGTSKVYWY